MWTTVWWYRLGLTPNLSTRAICQPPVLSGDPVSRDMSRASRRMGEGNENLIYSSPWGFKRSLTRRKILRYGTLGFTSHSKEGVFWIFIALTNPSHWPRSNSRPLGAVVSTLTTTPPRRHYYRVVETCRVRNKTDVALTVGDHRIIHSLPVPWIFFCGSIQPLPPAWRSQHHNSSSGACVWLCVKYRLLLGIPDFRTKNRNSLLDCISQCFSNCGPRWFACDFGRKAVQKLYRTLNECKIHPYMSVLKLPSLVDLQHKVGELVLYITSCPSIIIFENTLY
jgi:hypothetical protein